MFTVPRTKYRIHGSFQVSPEFIVPTQRVKVRTHRLVCPAATDGVQQVVQGNDELDEVVAHVQLSVGST